MSPFTTPKASSSTLTIGTEQFVVQEALDTTLWLVGSKVSSLTPTTKVASAPAEGADTITKGAPASRCIDACSLLEKIPVDSITMSSPRSDHGRAFGSRSARIWISSPSTSMPPSVTRTWASHLPRMVSYWRRWAMSSLEPRSLAATKSMSAPRCLAARKKLRPMRPNPLMPTRMLMVLTCSSSRGGPAIRADQPGPIQFGDLADRSLLDVAVEHDGSQAPAAQVLGHRLGDHDRSMAAPGAPEGDGEVRLPLCHVGREQQVEEALQLVEERGGGRLAEHVDAHIRVES